MGPQINEVERESLNGTNSITSNIECVVITHSTIDVTLSVHTSINRRTAISLPLHTLTHYHLTGTMNSPPVTLSNRSVGTALCSPLDRVLSSEAMSLAPSRV